MLKHLKARYSSLLGVDISPTSVKIVSISQYCNQFCIEGYGYEALPTNAFENASDKVVSAIKKILLTMNASAKTAAIAVPDSNVLSKTIQLVDNLNALEMEELIFLEADKHFGFQPNKLNLDFIVKGPSKSLGLIDILVFATAEDSICKRVDILNEAGLETKIVDIESYALASVFEHLFANKNQCIAVFDLGFDSIRLFILEQGITVYKREDSYEEAANHSMDAIILQIKRTIEVSGYEDIQQIFLTGEFSELLELPAKVQEQIGILTVRTNPFKPFTFSKDINLIDFNQVAPSYLVALGLALRVADA